MASNEEGGIQNPTFTAESHKRDVQEMQKLCQNSSGSGVRQGSMLSPLLFVLLMVLKQAEMQLQSMKRDKTG